MKRGGARQLDRRLFMRFTLFLEVPVLSLRRVPALFALLFLTAVLASACERNPAAAEEGNTNGDYCEQNPEHC